jgi:hypothetical protein
MKSNVFITHRRYGKVVERREQHNVWTFYGNQYLAELVALNGPQFLPTPERTDRVRYMGLGIGGVTQLNGLVDVAPLSTAYPVGSAERRNPPDYTLDGYTNGKEYDQLDPTSPRIETLERPIRRTGGETAYPGAAADRWFIEPPNLWHTHQSTQELTIHATLDAGAGDFVYGSFTAAGIPISEAGLFTSSSSPDGAPYQSLVAYVGFATILLDSNSQIEFVWRVRFG